MLHSVITQSYQQCHPAVWLITVNCYPTQREGHVNHFLHFTTTTTRQILPLVYITYNDLVNQVRRLKGEGTMVVFNGVFSLSIQASEYLDQ